MNTKVPEAGNARPITILHLSDIQFGKNHRFERHPLTSDETFDTLLSRLIDDSEVLKKTADLIPDILIATGDLAETGLPSEFDDVVHFMNGLSDHLNLSHDRVVLLPGNHDINRDACAAYFSNCSARKLDQRSLTGRSGAHSRLDASIRFIKPTPQSPSPKTSPGPCS